MEKGEAEGREEHRSENLKDVGCLLKTGICIRVRGLEGTRQSIMEVNTEFCNNPSTTSCFVKIIPLAASTLLTLGYLCTCGKHIPGLGELWSHTACTAFL